MPGKHSLSIQGSLNVARYRDEILHTYPLLSTSGQDNVKSHTARLTMDYLQNQSITMIQWPLKSPDLNPIEHLCDELDRRLRQRQPQPETFQVLQQSLQYE